MAICLLTIRVHLFKIGKSRDLTHRSQSEVSSFFLYVLQVPCKEGRGSFPPWILECLPGYITFTAYPGMQASGVLGSGEHPGEAPFPSMVSASRITSSVLHSVGLGFHTISAAPPLAGTELLVILAIPAHPPMWSEQELINCGWCRSCRWGVGGMLLAPIRLPPGFPTLPCRLLGGFFPHLAFCWCFLLSQNLGL